MWDKYFFYFPSFEEMDKFNSYYLNKLVLLGKRQFPIDYNSDIKSEEVSVVIQGTICDIKPMTIASIRKYLPNGNGRYLQF